MFSDLDSVKDYICYKTDRAFSLSTIEQEINNYYKLATFDSKFKESFLYDAKLLEFYKESPDFLSGNFFEGINDIVYSLISIRGSIYAFSECGLVESLRKNSIFFDQWYFSCTYSIFINLRKLSTNGKKENSLRNLWFETYKYLVGDIKNVSDEAEFICEKYNKSFPTTIYRNKRIAHNESNPKVFWDDIDQELGFHIRVWSLLVSWASAHFQVLNCSELDFKGLEALVGKTQICSLIEKKKEYYDKVKLWSKSFAHTQDFDKAVSVFDEPFFRAEVLSRIINTN